MQNMPVHGSRIAGPEYTPERKAAHHHHGAQEKHGKQGFVVPTKQRALFPVPFDGFGRTIAARSRFQPFAVSAQCFFSGLPSGIDSIYPIYPSVLSPPPQKTLRFPLPELRHIALHKDNKYDDGRHVRQVTAHKARKAQARPLVGLGRKLVPSPAVTGGAEQNEQNGSGGQHVAADKKILQIQHGGAFSQRLEPGQLVETQDAGQGQQSQKHAVDQHGLAPVPAPYVHAVGNNVLDHGDYCGQSGAAHEHEKECAPHPAARAWN